MRFKKIIGIFAVLNFALLMSQNVFAEELDKVVAIVNEDIITYSELNERAHEIAQHLSSNNVKFPDRAAFEKQVLNRMILDQIQLQMAKQFAVEVDGAIVNQEIERLVRDSRLTMQEYEQKVARELGKSFEAYRNRIKTELLLQQLQQREVGNDIRISAADIEGFLNSAMAHDNSGAEYNLGHILIVAPESPTTQSLQSAEAKAVALVKDLKSGKDFKQLAVSESAGMQALEGGDLGWRKLNELPTLFVKQVAIMQVGDVAGPIQSASGFHIIKLLNKRTGKQDNYAELRVRQILVKPGANTSDQEAGASLQELRKQILSGKDFARLAEKKSEELSTAVKGGDLGWINQKSVLPAFWQRVQNLKKDEISEPFKTEMGWHLVQLVGQRNSGGSADAVRHHAIELLRKQKFHELLEVWLKKIRDAAKVEILI